MTPEAREKAFALLQLNPDCAAWKARLNANLTEEQRRERLFAMFATWPDGIKGDKTFSDDGMRGGNVPTPADPNAVRNIGYTDKLRHKYWHFVDLPFSPDSTELHAPPTPNIESQIVAFRTALAASSSDEVRSYDLVWLLHLVGDLHQPLHAVSRFTKGQPGGDDGGNLVRFCMPPCRENLHSYWDGILGGGGFDPLTDVEAALNFASHLDDAEPAGVAITDVHAWATQSLELAKEVTYAKPIRVDPAEGPSTTNGAYRAHAHAAAEKQTLLAGYRLARLLNDALK